MDEREIKKPVLLEDMGMMLPEGTVKKVRFGKYLCPECNKPFVTRTMHILNGGTTKCRQCGYVSSGEKHELDYKVPKRLRGLWHTIKSRCEDIDYTSYKHYGGVGVRVEFKTLKEFVLWAKANSYAKNKFLHRLDVEKNYNSSNCFWSIKNDKNKRR